MNRSEVSSTHVMISIVHFKTERKGKLLKIISLELVPCPRCGGELFTRSTCRRKAVNSAGNTDLYQLRVLKCRCCGKTHRELPAPLVPYKRYDAEAIACITSEPETAPCNHRTIRLILGWLSWFLDYAKHIFESQRMSLPIPLTMPSGLSKQQELLSLVRLVVNSGNWSHNRTEYA